MSWRRNDRIVKTLQGITDHAMLMNIWCTGALVPAAVNIEAHWDLAGQQEY